MNIKIDDNVLHCPQCGENYLHHEDIEVFSREEDDDTTLVTTVKFKGSSTQTVPSDTANNPSSRRGGLRIKFWCEICTNESYLTIAQHKGCTLVDWET